jgi:cupin fold WbuC family metalloprotein
MKILDKDGTLLHEVVRLDDITHTRNDISSDTEFLQVACFRMSAGATFRPHVHIQNERRVDYTQESWVVMRGSVRVHFYGLDNAPLAEEVLHAGDCTITFRGGHTYTCLEDDTVVYEFKTGPYLGHAKDKVFLDD